MRIFNLFKKKKNFDPCWSCNVKVYDSKHYRKTAKNRYTGKIHREIYPYECPKHSNTPICSCNCKDKGFKTHRLDSIEAEI